MRKPKINSKDIQDKIISVVCEEFGVTMELICKQCRLKDRVKARQILCYLLYTHGNLSLPKIGKMIERDHTTIINSVKKVKGYKQTESEYNELLTNLIHKIFI